MSTKKTLFKVKNSLNHTLGFIWADNSNEARNICDNLNPNGTIILLQHYSEKFSYFV